MIIDGKAIANEIYTGLARVIATFPHAPSADIVIVGDDPVIENFVRIKKKSATSLGITLFEHRFSGEISEDELLAEVKKIGLREDTDGLIVQLPLPSLITVQRILDAIPVAKDVDVLSTHGMALYADEKLPILPPVAGAVKAILDAGGVSVGGEEVLVLGYGRLVGIPVSILMKHNNAHLTVIDREIADLKTHILESRIIISGVGKPNLITPDMLQKNTVLIDAGTSESQGKVVGDADPHCADVVALYTPVPGGVGPITVAMLLKNLCILAHEKQKGMSI